VLAPGLGDRRGLLGGLRLVVGRRVFESIRKVT
jgi:hypothetical protein